MAKRGYIVVEGAKVFCSSSVANNSKATAVPLQVKSQKKKLGKNKYFAQEKPIATYLDDKADSFGGGNGFGNCKGSDGKPYPCKAKCNIKYKDYYENVDFNKSMKVLLDVSTGICPGYGVPGTIQFVTTGQSNKVSQMDVKEADEFSVANASPQWKTKDPADKTKTLVSSIYMISPIPVTELKDTYYYIQQANNSWSPFSNFNILTPKLTLKANFKGEVTKIIWTLFKGEGVKDKVKTFIGLGGQFNQDLDSIFKNLEEGKYKIEAYGAKPGDAKCTLHIEVVKDFVKKITIPASSIINIPVPVSLERKVGSPLEQSRILNKSIQTSVIPSAYWRIKEGNNILHNTFAGTTSPNIVSVISSPSGILVTFKNKGKYTIEAFTNPNETKPESATIEIKSTLGIETIDHGNSLLRYNDNFSVWVKNYNAIYIPDGTFKTVNWYLKKEGTGRLRALESSVSFKALKINKRIDEFLFHDAGIRDGNYFGKYAIEAYANPLGAGKEPQFNGGDCFNFEVIKNSIDQLAIPATKVPQGTKVKYTATARISPLISGETIRVEVPQGVTNNGDSTLTFTELGEFTISAHMEGQYTDPKVTQTKIKVAQPKLKRALWAYGTGVKRTETGYEEETYGFLEIEGLQNQALKVKIWVKGETDGFYPEPAKYMLEEKPVTLNSEGKASFQITTNATYKQKIEKAIPKTADNPNPQYRLVFTIEPQIASTADIIFPSNFSIEGTKPVTIQGGATLLEVLEPNKELTLTSEQKITKILFSTEDGKDIQRTITSPGKTHKLQVHTVNMQEEVLKIDILKEIAKDQMQETDNIISALESVLSSTEEGEKVGKDGLLEFPVKIEEDWLKNVPSFIYLIGQVSQQFKDPADENKKIWKVVKAQYVINGQIPADLITTEDKDKVGIKVVKKNEEAFTQAEMAELRKRFLQYNSSCLKVVKQITPEAIDNDVVPVVVEMAEVKKEKTCWCNKPFLETDLISLVKAINGKEYIWNHSNCNIDDKSHKRLTHELNTMFSFYGINECIQKMAFLAMTSVETGFFSTAGEVSGSTASSQCHYKGRGILQLTGDGSEPVMYKDYNDTLNKKYDVVANPDLVATNVHLAVDSGGFVWKHKKSLSYAHRQKNRKDASQEDYEAKMKAFKWKRDKFPKGLDKNLNEIALLMKENEEDYFFLICRVLQGYLPKSTSDYPDTLHYERRKANFQKLKTWFKFDKSVCDETVVVDDNDILNNPKFRYIKVAGSFIGTKEFSNGKNPVIKKFFSDIGYNQYGQETSWCASFQNYCLMKGNPEIPRNNALNATSFSYSGYEEVETPFYGSFMVRSDSNIFYKSGSFGHVAIVIGKVGNAFAQLGGNQAVPGESSGTIVNVVLRERANNVKYFHPTGVPKITLGKPLFTPAEKTASVDTGNMTR